MDPQSNYPQAFPAAPPTPSTGSVFPQTPQQNISVNVPPTVPIGVPSTSGQSSLSAEKPHLTAGEAFARKGTEVALLLMGALEVALTIRFTFKLFAAQSANAFVNLLYQLTQLFVEPFAGIFRSSPSALGHVLEIETIVAGIIYALVGVALIKIVQLFK